jgi:hypothetical protein
VLSSPANVSLYGHFAVKCSPLHSLQTTLPAPDLNALDFVDSSGVVSVSPAYI